VIEYLKRIFGSVNPEPEPEPEEPQPDPECCPKCGGKGMQLMYHAQDDGDDNYLCVSDRMCGTFRAEPPQDAFSN